MGVKIMSIRGNMLIAQSGGPTAAINASLAGAVKQAMECPEIEQIYGAKNGVEGILRENIIDLRTLLRSEEDFARLRATPAMALGSCRKRLAEQPDREYDALREILLRRNIRYFFYIGGNDSMDAVKKLSAYFKSLGDEIRVIGIPKTIDNDMACTDHTPGFGSAARYIATSMAEIACDSAIYTPDSITLVEIMGRNAGWLTAAAALARRPGCTAPQLICMPEVPFEEEKFLRRVREVQAKENHVIVAVSEGIRYADGTYVAAQSKLDAFGHRQLSGAAHSLGRLLLEKIGCKVRPIELNVLQRAAAHLSSETDLDEAGRIGAEAVSLGVAGKTGVMATFERLSNEPYLLRYGYVEIGKVANVEKTVPVDWIDPERMDIRPQLIEYLSPLIQSPSRKEPGLPAYFMV
ncbi:6-phosphofructokinase [Neglectibacter caecimuris]|uniref:6-phosphofructokinase n=1 Tax=Neglectibacter caecimuris TaxID=3093658 RepID=UPI002AC9C430|nr:6-phosphofructokinase [Neglectibacter sp. M00184]